MKALRILIAGTIFGIVLTKAEVVSWYRIFEMFRFESFHMYGVIGSAVVLGAFSVMLIKKFQMKDFDGNPIVIPEKDKKFWPPLLGGTIFGLGWALTGACPGPIYIIMGNGYFVFITVFVSAIIGTFVYGLVRDKLPQK